MARRRLRRKRFSQRIGREAVYLRNERKSLGRRYGKKEAQKMGEEVEEEKR